MIPYVRDCCLLPLMFQLWFASHVVLLKYQYLQSFVYSPCALQYRLATLPPTSDPTPLFWCFGQIVCRIFIFQMLLRRCGGCLMRCRSAARILFLHTAVVQQYSCISTYLFLQKYTNNGSCRTTTVRNHRAYVRSVCSACVQSCFGNF